MKPRRILASIEFECDAPLDDLRRSKQVTFGPYAVGAVRIEHIQVTVVRPRARNKRKR